MPPAPTTPAPAGSPADRASSPEADPKRELAAVTIGELEAGYSLYCKALRLLIQEGRTLTQIQRTVCWQRLELLHTSLPGQYKDPEYLYLLLRRQNGGSRG